VAFLGDGRYACFPTEKIPHLVHELYALRPWMVAHEYGLFVEFIDAILRGFGRPDAHEYEYCFG
jgi:hypothetical protein